MIYEFPGPDEAIRQGDIFSGIPKPSVSLSRISIVTEDEETQAAEWDDLRKSPNPITALVGITPVVAVVITRIATSCVLRTSASARSRTSRTW